MVLKQQAGSGSPVKADTWRLPGLLVRNRLGGSPPNHLPMPQVSRYTVSPISLAAWATAWMLGNQKSMSNSDSASTTAVQW